MKTASQTANPGLGFRRLIPCPESPVPCPISAKKVEKLRKMKIQSSILNSCLTVDDNLIE